MKKFIFKNKKNGACPAKLVLKRSGGYALLFTLIIVSILLAIATGLSDSIFKEGLLSSTSVNSQAAFYQADTASECSLYLVEKQLPSLTSNFTNNNLVNNTMFSCGIDANGNPLQLQVTVPNVNEFVLKPLSVANSACFTLDINITPATSTTPLSANIFARGYNTCNNNDLHQVERGIEIQF